MQVRAAGSILHAHARRGRRAVLALNSRGRETQRVHSYDGDWRRALELLAAVEPGGATAPASALVGEESGVAARSLELTVVTGESRRRAARPSPPARARPAQRLARLRRRGELHGRRDATAAPGLLRLQSVGVPVAVLRQGDDLTAVLARAGGRWRLVS